MAELIVFHLQDPTGRPIPNVTARATSPTMGAWAAQGNSCGDIFTTLAPAHYEITFSAAGFQDRVLPADLGDSGIVTVGLEYGGGPHGDFKPAPRFWRSNMCGVRVAGLSPVDGGAADASLVLSWFYDRYSAAERNAITRAWEQRGLTHVLLSWPDSRDFGASPLSFLSTCLELIDNGFFPCVMLCSKDHDPADVPSILAGLAPVLDLLVGVCPMFCVGWELSLWLSPTQVQQLIDAISPRCMQQPGTLVYLHLQEAYPSFQQPGGTVADFWNPNVGKLTGLLYQKKLSQTDAQFLDSLKDCLERFGGGWGMVKGFDFVALELTAALQFNGSCSEAEGNRIGQLAINAPKVNGVGVSGSGNGL